MDKFKLSEEQKDNFVNSPATNLGMKIYSRLVENFPQSYFVGGAVRDLLLGRRLVDMDIATEAVPEQAAEILKSLGLEYSMQHEEFGIVTAKAGGLKAELATFRKDLPSLSRYPNIEFVTDPESDSSRRDFTVNALYLQANSWEILDFHNGLRDINNRVINFIGDPDMRIKEDPLRIVRALRFSLVLGFGMARDTAKALGRNRHLISELTKNRISAEADKIDSPELQKTFKGLVENQNSLDTFFKKSYH